MKRICILICCVLILQMLCGCAGKAEDFQKPVNFYYCNKEVTYHSASGVICPEVREGNGFHGNLTAFLHAYLLGPQNTALYSLIPSDVYLVSCQINEDEAAVVFSKSFEKLSGVDLSITCGALLLSIHDFTGANTVIISAKDGQLEGKDQVVFNLDDVVLMDTSL